MNAIRALVVCFAVAVPASADVWDTQSDNDNSQTTDNELIHGSIQLHDLGALTGGATDQDWYVMGQAPRSSYELVVDGISGDVMAGKGVTVERLAAGGSTVLQTSLPISVGLDYARSLRWENTAALPVIDQFLRIVSSGCTSDCGADDTYRVRFYETTFAIPRFNVTASQVTVLLIQNPTAYDVSATAYFWNPAGGLEHQTQPFTIASRALYSLNLSTVPILVNKSGTITISHNARYGDLVGKAVALEPATGFSFDTAMIWRPR